MARNYLNKEEVSESEFNSSNRWDPEGGEFDILGNNQSANRYFQQKDQQREDEWYDECGCRDPE